MFASNSEILNFMNEKFPIDKCESWDNVGLLVGENNQEIRKVLTTLDVTDEVLEEAINLDVQLIISHHPMIFSSLKKINDDSIVGKRIIKCIKNSISIYASHTNYDIGSGGTNDLLFKKLDLIEKEELVEIEKDVFIGKVGKLKNELTLKDFAFFVKEKLNLNEIRYVGSCDKKIKKIGLCTGSASGAKYFEACIKKECDLYLTGDVKHHDAHDAIDMGIALIDAGHFGTEYLMINALEKMLNDFFKEKDFETVALSSKLNKSVINTLI